MKEFFINMSGLIFQLVVAVGTVVIFQKTLQAKSNLVGNAFNRTKGLVNRARERAQNSTLYQRPKMARERRTEERRRSATEDYARAMTGRGPGSALLRMRAGGLQSAARQRALQSAEDILRRQRHEETERAAKNISRLGFEGDADLMGIARTRTGGTYYSERLGRSVEVTEAVRQAAVNGLVQQGRTGQVRDLETYDEATGTVHNYNTRQGGHLRGRGGAAETDLQRMLDHAYDDYGTKLSEKAPDLMPNRRASEGTAAFTDLQAADVAAWHASTVTAADRWYTATRDAGGAALTPAEITRRQNERTRMLRSYAEATRSPGTRQKLSLDQATRMRDIAAAVLPAGDVTRAAIEEIYTALGG